MGRDPISFRLQRHRAATWIQLSIQPFPLRGEEIAGINRSLTPSSFVEGAHMPFRGWEQWE